MAALHTRIRDRAEAGPRARRRAQLRALATGAAEFVGGLLVLFVLPLLFLLLLG